MLVFAVSACSALLTGEPDAADLMDAPLDGLSETERAAFLRGDDEFTRAFAPSEGLGPLFNDVSCAACHSSDGRGDLRNVLVRFTPRDPARRGIGEPQLQDKAIPGAIAETLPEDVLVSRRLPPPVFGMGLLEAVSEEEILARADPTDLDGDGVSGRPSYVTPPAWVPENEGGGAGKKLGRFSRKAQVSTLLEQIAVAYSEDMGITSDFLPEEPMVQSAVSSASLLDTVVDPETTRSTVLSVVAYVRFLAPPEPAKDTDEIARGRDLFHAIGCATCHVPELRTDPALPAPRGGRVARAFTDLLLHDMGDELADGRPDGDASGHEWRTAPLWGLRVARDFLGGRLLLLHDGRARTIDEAIRWHGGEGSRARDRYAAASDAERRALTLFVESR